MRVLALLAALALAACTTAPTSPGATLRAATPGETPATAPSPSSTANPTPQATPVPSSGPFTLASDAFGDGGAIPREYTCQGADVSPPLHWDGVPAGTLLYILIVDDADANGFVHWTVRIEGTNQDEPRGIAPDSQTDSQGLNGFGQRGWGGPCPPSGTHHYRFMLYALGSGMDIGPTETIRQVRADLAKTKILGTAVLTGTYRKT